MSSSNVSHSVERVTSSASADEKGAEFAVESSRWAVQFQRVVLAVRSSRIGCFHVERAVPKGMKRLMDARQASKISHWELWSFGNDSPWNSCQLSALFLQKPVVECDRHHRRHITDLPRWAWKSSTSFSVPDRHELWKCRMRTARTGGSPYTCLEMKFFVHMLSWPRRCWRSSKS